MIGFYTILKILVAGRWLSLAFVLFFVFHFGMFMYGRLIFISIFFSGHDIFENFGIFQDIDKPGTLLNFVFSLNSSILPALASLTVSHGISFFENFIGKKEYLAVRQKLVAPTGIPAIFKINMDINKIGQYTTEPYSRIILMQIALILGGLLILPFRQPIFGLVILILFKILVDIRLHQRQHAKYQTALSG